MRFARDDRIENRETIQAVLAEAIDRARATATAQSLAWAAQCERAHHYYRFILAENERLESLEGDEEING